MTNHEENQTAVETAIAAAQKSALRTDRQRRLDLDVRGLLAIFALTGAFALAFVQVWFAARIANSENILEVVQAAANIPAWAAAIVAGVTGFYFGSRGGSNGLHK